MNVEGPLGAVATRLDAVTTNQPTSHRPALRDLRCERPNARCIQARLIACVDGNHLGRRSFTAMLVNVAMPCANIYMRS